MAIRLYHPKSRAVREVKESDELVLRLLKRAGFLIGELPPSKKTAPSAEEAPLPPTEKDGEDPTAKKKPVLAKHAPVGTLQLPEGKEVDDAEDEAEENPFSEMNMKALRKVAKDNEIVIPWTVRSKVAIAAYLDERLEMEDDEEGEELE